MSLAQKMKEIANQVAEAEAEKTFKLLLVQIENNAKHGRSVLILNNWIDDFSIQKLKNEGFAVSCYDDPPRTRITW